VALAGSAGSTPHAGVDITVDAETLTALLSTALPQKVLLPVAGETKLTLLLENLKVTGFEPTGGKNGRGLLLTSLQLEVPELGLKMPVHPKLSLELDDIDGQRTCYLLFERVDVPLPVAGNVNIAYLLPRIPVPADNLTTVQSSRGLFDVRTRLAEARMGSRALRLSFDLDVSPRHPIPSGGQPGIE
jgi:hypothetical protein